MILPLVSFTGIHFRIIPHHCNSPYSTLHSITQIVTIAQQAVQQNSLDYSANLQISMYHCSLFPGVVYLLRLALRAIPLGIVSTKDCIVGGTDHLRQWKLLYWEGRQYEEKSGNHLSNEGYFHR